MRYVIGVISLLVMVYLIVSLIKHRKEKLGWKKGVLVMVSISTMFWGFASPHEITYAGVAVTSGQKEALSELHSHETILFDTMANHQEKLKKINTHADELEKPAVALSGSGKLPSTFINANIEHIKTTSRNRQFGKREMSAGTIHGILKINQRIAQNLGRNKKDAQAIFDEIQDTAGMPKYTVEGLNLKQK